MRHGRANHCVTGQVAGPQPPRDFVDERGNIACCGRPVRISAGAARHDDGSIAQSPWSGFRLRVADKEMQVEDGLRGPLTVVQVTVADGVEPAREVIHSEDNSWLVGDGINDPNPDGAATVLHMHHLLQVDPTLAARNCP